MVPIVISPDDAKKNLSGYDPKKAESVHLASSKIADQEFSTKLKENFNVEVILMSGGSASGKTEFVAAYLDDFEGIVFDSTLFSTEGARVKIKKILKAKNTPKIYAVFPDDLRRAFTAFLNRDRRFSDEHFYRTHCGSRKTLLWIAEKYPSVEIEIFESRYLERGDMSFYKYVFEDHKGMIEFLKNSQYTEEEVVDITRKV